MKSANLPKLIALWMLTMTMVLLAACAKPSTSTKPVGTPSAGSFATQQDRSPVQFSATAKAVPIPTRLVATATAKPRELIITEAEIEAAAANNTVPGLEVEGMNVRLGDESMTVTFDRLRYRFLSLRNVSVKGHFEVKNGDVDFVADQIQPRNLATAAIPSVTNQAVDQFLGQWYVKSLRIEPGQLVAQVQPK